MILDIVFPIIADEIMNRNRGQFLTKKDNVWNEDFCYVVLK